MSDNQTISPRFGSYPEAETYSGLSQSTLRMLVREGRLTVYRPVPGRTLLDFRQLDDVVRSGAGKPTARDMAAAHHRRAMAKAVAT